MNEYALESATHRHRLRRNPCRHHLHRSRGYLGRRAAHQQRPRPDHDSDGLGAAAFGWAYAVFEIPGGWLGDKIGPRRVLMRIVLWWSFFTAATGWVWSAPSLIATRALFGAGEAGRSPT